VSIVKGIAPASIGGTMSENVNITRSGGADYCGSLYEVNEVSPYDARNQVLTSKPVQPSDRITCEHHEQQLFLPE
jgi:hypothetical protein